ncbi:MAG: aminoacyl-tRNA hydrolase [Alphaproteobacteria bacterium]|nr:aminoacyl-tRNA hydrolase [Alphaproteobacteria bacterium]
MLWVGLGNPGSSYAKNRHNVGFMALDYLAEAYRFADWRQTKPAAETSGLVGTTKIRLLKPLSYMNRSGLPVAQMAKYYDIAPENILVFHDDIDLGAGKIRVKQGGGHGGHNGLRDIDRHIGKEYWRVRIGVGRPDGRQDVDKWVLSDFTKQEQTDWLDALLAAITSEAVRLSDKDMVGFASRVAMRAPAPKNKKPIVNGEENGL